MEIKLVDFTGNFAENKDVAKKVRVEKISPALEKGETVILNFQGVQSATQSFIHALISEIIKKEGIDVLSRIYFKNCNDTTRKIIEIVTEYMQDSF